MPDEEEDLAVFWGITGDSESYWEFLQQMHAAAESDRLTIKKHGSPKCKGCGKFMSLDDTYVTITQAGVVHMRDKCLISVVKKLREKNPSWDWGIKR